MDKIIDLIDKFSADFSWRRLGALLVITLILILCLIVYNAYTANIPLQKLERVTELLLKLDDLSTKDPGLEKKKIGLSLKIHEQLLEITTEPSSFFSEKLKQTLWPALLFFLLSMYYLIAYFGKKGEPDSSNLNGFGGALLFAIVLGVGGYMLPTQWNALYRYVAYPIVGHGVLIGILWLSYKKNKKQNSIATSGR